MILLKSSPGKRPLRLLEPQTIYALSEGCEKHTPVESMVAKPKSLSVAFSATYAIFIKILVAFSLKTPKHPP